MSLPFESVEARWPRGFVLGCALVVSLGVSIGCSEEQVEVEELLPSVIATEIAAIDLEQEIRASGDLQARSHTMIAAEVDGRVTEVRVDEGGEVESGGVVLEIDPERRQLDLAAAEARLAQAQANLRKQRNQARRIRKLRKQKVASVQQLEEADTALLLAEASVRAEEAAVGVAQRAVTDSSVTAPFDGLVARRAVEVGEFVDKGTELFELVALDPLEAIFSLTELDTERVAVGQKVLITVGAFRDRRFEGVVTFVAPTVDPATRTLRIKAEVDNAAGSLRPGLFARVSLGVDRRPNVLMVPEEAVIQRAGGASLYRIVEGDRVERVRIETGATANNQVEVRGDIRAGDRIVSRGHGGLSDGMVVVVQETRRAPISDVAGAPQGGGS